MSTRSRPVAARALIAAACAGCSALPGGGHDPAPRAPRADTITVFADEFSGATLDRSRWTVYTGPVYNREAEGYVDDSSTIRIVHGPEAAGATEGALLIGTIQRPGTEASGGRYDFVSGRLHGNVSFRYGTARARMKLPAGAGLWPAFWLLGSGAWPDHGEIDIMENVGDPAWISVALHGPGYSGNTPLLARHSVANGSDATGWHEYAVRWTPEGAELRVDETTIYRVSRTEIARHGPPAAIDSAKFVVLNLAVGGEYPAAVNGVQAPYLGLPETTVRRIARGEAVMLVDWVRVTRP